MRGVTVPPHIEAFLRGVDAINRGDDSKVFQLVDGGSGFETDVPTAAIIEFRENGVMQHYRDYGDARRALQEAGLPPG
jgi:hypothetical protein